MTQAKSPHTQSGQNQSAAETDAVAPGERGHSQSAIGTDVGQDAIADPDAQTGTNRGPEFQHYSTRSSNTEPMNAAQEGSLSTRTPGGERPGITAHTTSEESARQKKVVSDRDDAQAGVNVFKRGA